LYDPNEITRIAQSMVLGIGGAKVLDLLHLNIKNYHLNEGHALPVTNYLFSKYKSIEKVKEKMLFTTHTPEAAGNELRNIQVLKEMRFFLDLTNEEINTVTFGEKDTLNYTLSALRLSRKANAVSKLHGEVARDMWKEYTDIAPIISITNAQKLSYWQDEALAKAVDCNDLQAISENKQVKLYWNSLGSNQQYAVYVVDTVKHIYNRVNEQIISDTFYRHKEIYFIKLLLDAEDWKSMDDLIQYYNL
jgi:starch phosphorylase